MPRKFSLLLAAAAVLVLAVPAFANAATGLTKNGALAPVGNPFGTFIEYASTTPTVVTSTKTGNVTCPVGAIFMEAELTTNTSAEVKEVGGGFLSASATCKNVKGEVAAVKNVILSSFKTTGGGTGTASLSFEIEPFPGGLTCKYSTSAGAATYNPTETSEGGGVITISEQTLSVTPLACGTTAKLDGSYTMTTTRFTVKGVEVFTLLHLM